MTVGLVAALLALVAVLAFAVARPRGLPEVVLAAPVAAALVILGEVGPGRAWAEVTNLLPVVGFLVAVLLLGHLCEVEGLFAAAGRRLALAAGADPGRLLIGVFVAASAVTVALSLDATVVLLTPVVLATASRARLRPRPHVYACTHLANSASLLLPVSNLTNLLALRATGLGFGGFAARMALPWVAVVVVEYVVLRRYFRADLRHRPARQIDSGAPEYSRAAVGLVVATLAGFLLAAALGVPAVLAAGLGAAVLAGFALRRGRTSGRDLLVAANLPFAAFVLALGVVVLAVTDSGMGEVIAGVLPSGTSWLALLGVAGVAALAANLLNNLPAVLVLAPLAASTGGPVAVLAVVLGVNLGPNLTYVGSLATLLWRRLLHAEGAAPQVAEFTALGAMTVPLTLLAGATGLWLTTMVLGAPG